jgi:prepilin-type N-terminal cleavage/methylation domain-containing protein
LLKVNKKFSERRVVENLKGFTLLELLAVIAIITLLMSILMPVLAKVRQQAKAVACQVNLKQWGIIWNMYVGDRNGFFPTWKYNLMGPNLSWSEVLRPLYQQPKMRCCPEATEPLTFDNLNSTGARPPHASWGKFSGRYPAYETRGDYGSYGYNSWAGNDDDPTILGPTDTTHWRTINVKNAQDVP